MISLIAVIAIGAIRSLGSKATTNFATVGNSIVTEQMASE